FVGEILIRHIPGITAVGNLAHRVYAEEGNDRLRGVSTDLFVPDQTLARDDEALRGAGQVQVGHGGSSNTAVSESIRLMHLDRRSIGIERRKGNQLIAGKRTNNGTRSAMPKCISA